MLKTTRSLAAALSIGISAFAIGASVVAPSPAHAAGLVVENKALVDAINGAQADAKAGRYAEALAKAKVADGIAVLCAVQTV